MVRPQRLLPNRQRALVERLGLRVLALGVVEQSQIVQARGHIGMIGAAVFLCATTRRTHLNSSLWGIHLSQPGPMGSVSAAWKITLRFNRRTSRHRGKLFYRLLQQAVSVEPVPFSKLVVPRSYHG